MLSFAYEIALCTNPWVFSISGRIYSGCKYISKISGFLSVTNSLHSPFSTIWDRLGKLDHFNCQSQAIFGLEAKFLHSACVVGRPSILNLAEMRCRLPFLSPVSAYLFYLGCHVFSTNLHLLGVHWGSRARCLAGGFCSEHLHILHVSLPVCFE